MKHALILILLTGCYIEPDNPETDPPPGTDALVEIAEATVAGWLGAAPPPIDAEIIWLEGECIEGQTDNPTPCPLGQYLYDRRWAPDVIYVLYREPVWATLLAHELLHHWQHRLGDADPDHESAWWHLESEINRVAKEQR